ncbi:F-box/LRR-repeat protein 25-like [Rutidosis leptorrhynchoides]|uniref:F-box/LRR-repeat protein 25-like n=1 Tax=Rutidosis leptorrhynchoides TaxID=125765 RepID=UPI003A9961BF
MDLEHNNVRATLNEDRLSGLPHELIHQILSPFDTIFVVQTCLLLSPRWKLIWTSMPYLNFSSNGFRTIDKFSNFVTHVLSHHNHQVQVSSVYLKVYGATSQDFVRKIANYVISHNVQELILDIRPNLSHEKPTFRSKTHTFDRCLTPKTPWDFPALTTLYLDHISLCDDRRESIDLFSKCVNLKNLTLNSVRVEAKVLEIITPRLATLRLVNYDCYNAINVIAPQLENLTIINCLMKEFNIPSELSSFYYKGYHTPQWIKKCFNSVNKVTVSLSICCPNLPSMQEHACSIIDMLQELHSARFLTLNLDIVECISSFPELVSAHSSPFRNLIRLNIDSGSRDTCKVKMSTEARNFLLENSPNATFIMKELPMKSMKDKEVKERKKAKLVSDIEDLIKELQKYFKSKLWIKRNHKHH